MGQVAYRLALPPHMLVHDVFHVSLIKKYHGTPPTHPTPALVQGHEEFEIQRILQHRYRHRRLEFLVLWAGYPASDATWEPFTTFRHAQCILHKYATARGVTLPCCTDVAPTP